MNWSHVHGGSRRLQEPGELCEVLQVPFSEEQLQAICAPLEPGVIIAGAGSGKTTVMAARVVWLVGTGILRPEEVLGLTFTRKAAAELAGRVRDSLQRSGLASSNSDAGEEVIMTYDAFASHLVAEHGLRLGLETNPMLITGAARFRLGARVVNQAPGPFAALPRLRPATVIERMLELDAGLVSHLVSTHQIHTHCDKFSADLAMAPSNRYGNVYASVRDAQATLDERRELADLVDCYQHLKAELGLTEFADQLAAAAHLVHAVDSVSALLRDRFKVVLLDEYQDTSSAQAVLLQGLFGHGHPVTTVGDPFQAIYGWRGAAASNITVFSRDFPRADSSPATQFQLSVNRRSRPRILAVANRIGADLRRAQSDGGTRVAELCAQEGVDGGEVVAAGFETVEAEISWVAEQIADAGRDPQVRWSDTAVLVRRNADLGPLYDALIERDIPVEIVGLGGLLALGEVAPVLATLHLLNDVTANADLITLLSGPRWQIGPNDLALLGTRARELARAANPEQLSDSLIDELDHVVEAADASEVLCLFDALLNPGEAELSTEARQRIQNFVTEFAWLQENVGEPLPDLVRRVILSLGVDVEAAVYGAGRHHDATAQLTRLVEAVADYAEMDAEASLSGLLAYFDAEISHGIGLEQASPSEQNSVKLLTVHKAKGLEWPQVYLPGLADKVFPSERVTDNYVRRSSAIPAPLRGDADSIPQLAEVTDSGIKDYAQALKTEQILAEDRLAYVAVTRAKERLVGTWHVWAAGLQRPRKPSPYFLAIREEAQAQGKVMAEAPPSGDHNPCGTSEVVRPWPHQLDEETMAERRRAAEWVDELRHVPGVPEEAMSAEAAALVAAWDADLDLLVAQAAESDRTVVQVQVPTSLSVTSATRLQDDPQTWAANEIRPMPKAPSPAAELGSRFHAWVQRRFEVASLFDDRQFEVESDQALEQMIGAFESGPYAHRTPVATEVPFMLQLGAHVIRGRIDAVYRGPDGDQVVDWKTSNQPAEPWQLAFYRLAWAKATGCLPEQVDAVFYHVRSGEIHRPPALPDEAALVAALDQR